MPPGRRTRRTGFTLIELLVQLPQSKQDTGAFRHNGGATYIFVDGHAHWYRPEQIPCTPEKCWWAIENHH
jgi:prepilin-type processing-associated H-X9-DG protein